MCHAKTRILYKSDNPGKVTSEGLKTGHVIYITQPQISKGILMDKPNELHSLERRLKFNPIYEGRFNNSQKYSQCPARFGTMMSSQ